MSTWALVTLEGDAITSSSLKGKVVIMDFWATWCPPCRKEIPSFIALQEAYGDKGLVVLGVSLDDGGPQVVRAFADKAGINYPLAMGNRDILKAAGGVEALPTTLIINRDGDVVDKHVGYASKETFEKAIQPLL
jgi:thiol-disulfide isomerase/thioredoxin